jgi:menaquinone-specific isochorismate synthase
MAHSLAPCFQQSDAVERPYDALADRVRTVLAGTTNGASRAVRVCVPVADSMDPIGWLRAQAADEVVYWADRAPDATPAPSSQKRSPSRTAPDLPVPGRRVVAAVGRADVLTSTEQPVDYAALQDALDARLERSDASIRYYGGFRFDAPQAPGGLVPESDWTAFGTYRFVLPRVELVQHDDEHILACNLVLPRDANAATSIVERLRSLAPPTDRSHPSLPAPTDRVDRPGRADWTSMVQWALDRIRGRGLEKVVFARQVEVGLGRPVDPLDLLHHLKAATPGCFHFGLRSAAGPAFVGASPERLVRRVGDRVVSEAVAGTRKRGDTPAADAALREELLTSDKERREHAFVERAIRRDLEALCRDMDPPEPPAELALARGRHLHARLAGTLRNGVSTLDLLDALHPTPAVGGVPRDEALAAIRDREPFDRGWYAGPVGWMGSDAAEFAVAIRSGLVRPERLALFSGAGIVEGSVPGKEWDEIEQKIGDFAAVLGLLDADGTAHDR